MSVARGVEDYYAGRGESPGIWAGNGAALLGLGGVVGEGDLGRLMRGEDPSSGERLRPSVRVRTIMVERLDPATGERRLVERELRPVAGFDLVFAVPKSVSVLHALGPHDLRLAIAQAHEASWQSSTRLPGRGGMRCPRGPERRRSRAWCGLTCTRHSCASS